LLLCAIGVIGTELFPTPFIMKLQPFRSVAFILFISCAFWGDYLRDRWEFALQHAHGRMVQLWAVCAGALSLVFSAYFTLLGAFLILLLPNMVGFLFGSITLCFPILCFLLNKWNFEIPLYSYFHDETLKFLVITAMLLPAWGLFAPQIYFDRLSLAAKIRKG